jgi:hypothetical protein
MQVYKLACPRAGCQPVLAGSWQDALAYMKAHAGAGHSQDWEALLAEEGAEDVLQAWLPDERWPSGPAAATGASPWLGGRPAGGPMGCKAACW